MSDQTPSPEHPDLAAHLPATPANRFWRVREVWDTRNFWQQAPTVIEYIRNSLPSPNPNKLRLELREDIAPDTLKSLNLSRPIAAEVIDIKDLSGPEVISQLSAAADVILLRAQQTETMHDRTRTFTGDYR